MSIVRKVHKLEDLIRNKSPLKRGLKIKNEDTVYQEWSKMSNHVYLGNIDAAKDKKFFKDKKIRAVLNCSKDIKNYFADNAKIEYMRIPIDDSLKEIDLKKMYNFFPVIAEFIYKHADLQKQNIFIHCHMGRQRSISAFCAYLMGKKKLNVNKACEYALLKRPEAFHFGESLNFSQSLVKYQADLDKNKKKC